MESVNYFLTIGKTQKQEGSHLGYNPLKDVAKMATFQVWKSGNYFSTKMKDALFQSIIRASNLRIEMAILKENVEVW